MQNYAKDIMKGAAFLSIISYVILIFRFIISFIKAGGMGPTSLGALNLSIATVTVFAVFNSSFIVGPIIKLVAENYRSDENRAVSILYNGLIIGVFIAVIATSICIVSAPLISDFVYQKPVMVDYLVMLSPIILTQSVYSALSSYLWAVRDIRKLIFYNLATASPSVLILINGVLINWEVPTMIIATIAAEVIILVFTIFLTRNFFRQRSALNIKFSKVEGMGIFRYGKYYALANLAYLIFLQLDFISIGIFIPLSADIGFYSFALGLVNMALLSISQIGGLLFPATSEINSIHGKEKSLQLLRISMRVMAVIFLPITIFVFVFSGNLLLLAGVVGSLTPFNLMQYIASSTILSTLSIIVFLKALQAPLISYYNGIGRFDINAKITVPMVVLAIILYPILAINLNILGVAIANVLCYVLPTLLWFYITSRLIGSKLLGEYYIKPIISGIISVVPFIFLQFIINNVFIIILYIPIYILIYFIISTFLRTITMEEINFIQQFLGNKSIISPIIRIMGKLIIIIQKPKLPEDEAQR